MALKLNEDKQVLYSLPVINEKKQLNKNESKENLLDFNNKIKTLTKKVETQNVQLSSMLWTYVVPNSCDFYYINKSEFYANESQHKIGPYMLEKLCGVGNFASVQKCKKDDQEMAIKIITKKSVTTISAAQRIENEISALHKLNSQYITNLYDTINTNTILGLVLELGPQDLYSYFDDFPNGVDEVIAKKIALNILDAVNYCHKKGVYHRDIKPENVLLHSDTYDVKLCDFGLCAFDKEVDLKDFVGSPGFFAPEMLQDCGYKGDKADVWSVGAVILEMVVGHDMFYKCWLRLYDTEYINNREMFKTQIKSTVQNIHIINKKNKYTSELIGFLKNILAVEPKNRCTVAEICEDSWILQTNTPSCSFFSDSSDSICPPIQGCYPSNVNTTRYKFIKF